MLIREGGETMGRKYCLIHDMYNIGDRNMSVADAMALHDKVPFDYIDLLDAQDMEAEANEIGEDVGLEDLIIVSEDCSTMWFKPELLLTARDCYPHTYEQFCELLSPYVSREELEEFLTHNPLVGAHMRYTS